MVHITFCDRCGKKLPEIISKKLFFLFPANIEETYFGYDLPKHIRGNAERRNHLCLACRNDLIKWFNNK